MDCSQLYPYFEKFLYNSTLYYKYPTHSIVLPMNPLFYVLFLFKNNLIHQPIFHDYPYNPCRNTKKNHNSRLPPLFPPLRFVFPYNPIIFPIQYSPTAFYPIILFSQNKFSNHFSSHYISHKFSFHHLTLISQFPHNYNSTFKTSSSSRLFSTF